ncbi:MAG TPA: AMP-binding protein [Candidatus Binatia bacterium]|nr:AMP-binding protein [Candidatus Binatia bacterium]
MAIAANFLRRAAERWPERVGFVERRADGSDDEVSFGALEARVRHAAAELRARGVRERDRVVLLAGNGTGVVVAWFAVTYAGATVIPVSTVSAAREVAHRLDHARCRAIVYDRAWEALAREAVAASSGGAAAVPLDELLAAAERAPADVPAEVDPASPAMILYTSGTTGEAKGALISHAALVTHTRVLVDEVLRLRESDRILGVLPLAHSFGCRMVMLASLRAGCRCVLVPRFDAAASLAAMIEERITWVPAVPTMYAAWGALPDGPKPASLRWCLAAGSPMADEIARRAEARFGVEVRQAYGMTEATISTLNTPPDERIYGCVGRPAPGIEVRIVDGEDRDARAGETGEVLIRGRNLMSGYLDDPAATAEAMRGGWMHTGDIGRLDDSGRLFVVDRLKDLIIRGGNNVYPSEVEAALASHPGVREVAVVGRPDDYLGEEVVAVVVAHADPPPSAEDLRDWAAARVAATKVPREYAFVDALPLGPSRKVLKRALREEVASGRLRAIAAARSRRA